MVLRMHATGDCIIVSNDVGQMSRDEVGHPTGRKIKPRLLIQAQNLDMLVHAASVVTARMRGVAGCSRKAQ